MGTLFVMIGLGMNPFINAQGFGKVGMMTVVLGAVVNIVLDPIFIFLLDMGVQGAALATVISQGMLGGVGAEIPHREAGPAPLRLELSAPQARAGEAASSPWACPASL